MDGNIKCAKKYGIKEVSTLTNALLLTPEKFEQMMEAGLDWQPLLLMVLEMNIIK